MYSCGPPLMDVQVWDDQHELTYSSYVRTRVVILKTCRRRWVIGRNGERRSGISAQAARHDDDDDDENYLRFNADEYICFHTHDLCFLYTSAHNSLSSVCAQSVYLSVSLSHMIAKQIGIFLVFFIFSTSVDWRSS